MGGQEMTESGRLPGFEDRVFRAIRQIIRGVAIHSRRLSRQHQITTPQLVCLHEIIAAGATTSSALARRVHLSPSTIVGILDRLGAKGLVERQRDQRDRRLVNIRPTEKGKALALSAPSPLQGALGESLKSLPAEKQAFLADVLTELVGLMEARLQEEGTSLTAPDAELPETPPPV